MASRIALRLSRLQQLPVLRAGHVSPIRLLGRPSLKPLPVLLRRCYSAETTVSPSDPAIAPVDGAAPLSEDRPAVSTAPRWVPPAQCPGCGAPSQQVEPDLPGFYPRKPRKRVEMSAKKLKLSTKKSQQENKLWQETLKRIEDPEVLLELGVTPDEVDELAAANKNPDYKEPRLDGRIPGSKLRETLAQKLGMVPEHLIKDPPPPICNRCHELKHHHNAPPLPSYPTLDTLTSLLLSTKHKHNHIYHLIDAADFPLTLHPELRNHLYTTLPKSITRNLTISYVITRCDVIVPKRDHIASLMTYFKSTLKSFLPEDEKVEGHAASNTKIYAISSRTGWDIGALKEEITRRQGGVWFLGAVNVGKSTLLRDVWPVDGELRPVSLEDAAEFEILPAEGEINQAEQEPHDEAELTAEEAQQKLDNVLDQAQQKAAPLARVPPSISEVAGTTAAPIRVSYKSVGRGGKYRGEVVDLPGLERWTGMGTDGLMKYVQPKKRRKMLLKTRVEAEQITVKPGQSILIGGLIMVTPKSDEIMLVNPFTSLPVHVARTSKCLGFLNSPDPEKALQHPECLYQDPTTIGITEINKMGYGAEYERSAYTEQFDLPPELQPEATQLPTAYKSAGVFKLLDDVTTTRNPMLHDRSPEGVASLPYKVLATDIVMEGLGWLELTSQVRNRRDTGYQPVEVEVFTPEGKGIAQRKCMKAYMMLESTAREEGLRTKTVRPRKSMKGQKKLQKKKSRGAA